MLEAVLRAEVRECETVWRGLRMALMRTHGVMLFCTRPRFERELEPFREQCRRWQPVQSKYSRFELADNNIEDWRALLRVALKGDVVDIGVTASGAFDALYTLLAVGVPQVLLGAESFLAGVAHLQPMRYLSKPGVPLAECGDPDLIDRVNIALNGAVDGVRLRAEDDEGEVLPLVEVYVPHPQLSSEVQGGRMQEAYEQWTALCNEHGPKQVRDQALLSVLRGRMDPRDFEAELGPIQWRAATRDRIVQGFEM